MAVMSFNRIGNSSLILVPGKVLTADQAGTLNVASFTSPSISILFLFLCLLPTQGRGLVSGHNHESRFQSAQYLHTLKNHPIPIDTQPKPVIESEADHPLVTINDEDQLLTIFNFQTNRVCISVVPSHSH
jgi:hypothetical protein